MKFRSILRFLKGSLVGPAFASLWVTSAFGLPYDGASVSVSGAQYTLSSTNQFTTAANGSLNGAWASTAGPNTVYASFFDDLGVEVSSFLNATLEVSAVDFNLGLTSGAGGGFAIKNSLGDLLLSGVFGNGSVLSSSGTGADFQSSMIVDFWNSSLIGTNFYAPGLFSATLGDVGSLALGQPFTTRGSATATIQSSTAPVPEPSVLFLLGVGLIVVAVATRTFKQHSS